MEFRNPWWLLGLLPVVGLVGTLLSRRSRPATVPFSATGAVRRAGRDVRASLWRLPDWMRVVALALAVVALARPQEPDRSQLAGRGYDILVALDVSGSMNAVDRSYDEIETYQRRGAEPPNRFEAARAILKEFVGNRRQDRVGLVVFGADVFLKFPLTLDYRLVLDQIDDLVLDDGMRRPGEDDCLNGCTISGAGTALGDALSRAYKRLENSTAKGKAIVLITDGKAEGSKLDARTVAEYIASNPACRKEGTKRTCTPVRVYTFLVGSAEKAKLPRRDPFTGEAARDRAGHILYGEPPRPFPTDEPVLRDIAALTGGKFYAAYDEDQFRAQFAELETTEFKSTARPRMQDVYIPWLVAALGLLGLEWLLRFTLLRRFP